MKNLFILLLVINFIPVVFSNIKTSLEDALSSEVHVGLLKIRGVLMDSSYYVKKIDEFAKASDIKGLILKIESPGGAPGTSQELFNEIKKFKKDKPVVVFTENICGSGAYYAAIAANKIICTPSALMGSIGNFMQITNVKDLLDNWKIKTDFIQSGEFKTVGSPLNKKMTPEERAYLQEISDDIYKQFTQDVAQCRKLDLKKHQIWANGKVFTGNAALKLNLVDCLGSMQDATDAMKKLLKTKEELKFIQPAKKGGLLSLLGGEDDIYGSAESTSSADTVAKFLSNVYNKFLPYQVAENNTLKPC